MISALITIAAASLLVVIDRSIKLWATVNLAPVGSMPLIPGVVELRYYLNDGAAFSILQGKQTFLILFTGAALLVVAWYLLFKKPAKKLQKGPAPGWDRAKFRVQSITVLVRPMPTEAAVIFFQVLQPQMPSAVRPLCRW